MLQILQSAGHLRKVLIIPPDITRYHSYAGPITRMITEMLEGVRLDIMPALGTHTPMVPAEIADMYPGVPPGLFRVHSWREDVVKLGEVPEDFVREISEGRIDTSIDVEVNRRIVDAGYDLIVSVGQIVPHEVAGMSGYTKNILVGCGGPSMINMSHYIGALYGIERILGTSNNPVQSLFDFAEDHYLKNIPLLHVMTVMSRRRGSDRVESLSLGRGRGLYRRACEVSLEKNVTTLARRRRKIVVYLDPREFKSTWLGNKAVYRTRKAIADGGELLIIAPGVQTFGEDRINDRLIRSYGYRPARDVVNIVQSDGHMAANLSVAAHLIHGSPGGRFSVTYAPGGLDREEVEGVGYRYMPLDQALRHYDPEVLPEGPSVVEGEEIYFIKNPALGLWTAGE